MHQRMEETHANLEINNPIFGQDLDEDCATPEPNSDQGDRSPAYSANAAVSAQLLD